LICICICIFVFDLIYIELSVYGKRCFVRQDKTSKVFFVTQESTLTAFEQK
jgi:hypothetical protein